MISPCRRNDQQVQQVNADGESRQIGDQYDPAVRVRLVGHVLPFEDRPENECREHRRQRVYLSLDGREPERIGERVGSRSDESGSEYRDRLRQSQLVAAFAHRAPGQMRDRPEQEHDRRPARQRRHRVDEHGRLSGASEHREEARDHHEERRSGRVSYLELARRRDKLAAIPEAGRGLHRQKVNRRREDEAEPADDQVEFLETVLHAVVLRYVKFRRAFRPIRPKRRRIIPAKLEK